MGDFTTGATILTVGGSVIVALIKFVPVLHRNGKPYANSERCHDHGKRIAVLQHESAGLDSALSDLKTDVKELGARMDSGFRRLYDKMEGTGNSGIHQ